MFLTYPPNSKKSMKDTLLDLWVVVVMLTSISPVSMVKGGFSKMVTFEQSLDEESLNLWKKWVVICLRDKKRPEWLELREQGRRRSVRKWSEEADRWGLGLLELFREEKNFCLILASLPLITWPSYVQKNGGYNSTCIIQFYFSPDLLRYGWQIKIIYI